MILASDSTTVVSLRSLDTPASLPGRASGRSVAKPRRKATRWGKAIGVLGLMAVAMLGMVFTGGLPGSNTPPAHALFDDVLCMYGNPDEYAPTPQPWPGVIGGLGLMTRQNIDTTSGIAGTTVINVGDTVDDLSGTLKKYYTPYGDGSNVTAYEWYGTAGLTWKMEQYDTLGAQCPPFAAMAGNTVANMVAFLGQAVGEVGLTIFGWAMSVDAIEPFLGSIDSVVKALRDALFLEYMTPILMLGALWMAWVGLVKKRSTEAIQGVAWMVGASAAAIFFLNQPAALAKGINFVVTSVSERIVNTTLDSVSGVPGTNLCGSGGDGKAWRTAQCQIWQTYMFAPWVAGTLGPVANSDIKVEGEWDGTSTAVKIPGKNETTNIALVYLDSQTFNHDQTIRVVANITGAADTLGPDGDMIVKKTAQWHAVYDAINEGDAYAARSSFTGSDWTGRLGIAFINIIAMAVGAFPILFLAFSLVVMQLGFVLLLLASPLFLTLGIHPGFGRRITLGWVEMLLSLSIKRIGTSVMLAILLAIFMAVQRATDAWLAKALLVAAVSVAVMVFRKQILDRVSKVSLGGDGGVGGEALSQKGKRTAMIASRGVARGTSQAVATEGSKAGALLTGAAVGIMMGQRGTVAGGAHTAWQSGKAAANRKNASKGSSSSGGGTVDPGMDPVAAREQRAKEEAEQSREDQAQRDLERQQVSPQDQAAGWRDRYERTGRAAPAPTDEETLRLLNAAGVPVRPRLEEVRARIEADETRRTERVVTAAENMNAARDADTQVVVQVLGEHEAAADRQRSQRHDQAGPTEDLARKTFERYRAKAQEQADRLEAEQQGQGQDSHTRTVGPSRPPKIEDQ